MLRTVPPDSLPPHVDALLRERVPGLDELVLLLVLRREGAPGRTAASLAEELCLSLVEAEAALASLCAASLLVADGRGSARRFVYRPATPALAASVTSLAELHDQRPTEVIRTLNESAVERVRCAALRAFPTRS